MENIVNNSIKEYYIKLLKLEQNAVNMLTAMRQSLSSTSSEVSVNMIDDNNTETTVRIPSFLYLENKLEQLENNFNNLFHMPDSGEAWFSKSSDMYKLELVKNNIAPLKPVISNTTNIKASISDNNFLRDIVSPKTSLRLNISNLSDNIEKVFVKKIIFNNSSIFDEVKSAGFKTYDEYVSGLYNLTKGIEYDEYDSEINLPIRKNTFNSEFRIVEIPELEGGNPWVDNSVVYSDTHEHLSYKIKLSTLQYSNEEDTSITYTLKAGDYISLPNHSVIYKVKNVDITTMNVIIEEQMGHVALQTWEDNNDMYFALYNETFSDYHYVDVPLEENQYIAIFIGTIYQNTRSLLSEAILVDLSTIKMYDENGTRILDENGTHMSYIEYYDKYCNNIGDLLLGITEVVYPQVSNYTKNILYVLQNGDEIKDYVDNTFINIEANVVPINKHLMNTVTNDEILQLNAQKAEIQSQLSAVQTNINLVYNTLITNNSASDEVTTQLNGYYIERTELNKQLDNVINNIAALSTDVALTKDKLKYRVRSVTNIDGFEEYLKSSYGEKTNIVGIDIEYKYKSIAKDTSDVITIGNTVFTNWVKQQSIERNREFVFNSTKTSFAINYTNYDTTQNIIKWNQLDIPITQGEDVVVRIRYKYNIGQPFVDLYTPWSSERTFVFPTEYTQTTEITNIIAQNTNDAIASKFTQALVNEGYEEHKNNSISQNNVTFYHKPENIYSGFNTSDNNYISLKDKLQTMNSDITDMKDKINMELNKKYSIYLSHDNTMTELFTNSINKINVFNSDHVSDSFVKNKMNLVIKNTGDVIVKLYTLFPGNSDISLLRDNEEFFEASLINYERVPVFIDNKIECQTLNQWIYFRQNNPYTSGNIYRYSKIQEQTDYLSILNINTNEDKHVVYTEGNEFIKKNYNQMLLGARRRSTGEVQMINNTIMGLDFSSGVCKVLKGVNNNEQVMLNELYGSLGSDDFFKYTEYNLTTDNKYLCRYEDIVGLVKRGKKQGMMSYLDENTSISEFISNNTVENLETTSDFVGAFLFPDIVGKSTMLVNNGNYIEIPVGGTISLPITFEYYIDGETTSDGINPITSITKALYFDIRDSLVTESKHYMLDITANYDYSSTNSILNTSLNDDVVNY